MPLVHISLKQQLSPAKRRAIADTVHRALVEGLGIPAGDRFQIIGTYGDDLIYDAHFLGIERTDGIVIIEIELASGRTVEQKKKLFKAIADGLAAEQGFRPEDVFVGLIEVARENISFGLGIAQFAGAPPPHLASLAAAQA